MRLVRTCDCLPWESGIVPKGILKAFEMHRVRTEQGLPLHRVTESFLVTPVADGGMADAVQAVANGQPSTLALDREVESYDLIPDQ